MCPSDSRWTLRIEVLTNSEGVGAAAAGASFGTREEIDVKLVRESMPKSLGQEFRFL